MSRCVWLLFLVGCGGAAVPAAPVAPGWTLEGAFSPHLARIDADGDGRVEDPEWAAVAYAAPALGNLDQDGDDVLSVAELLAYLDTVDPATFDGARRSPPAEGETAPLMGPAGRHAWEELTLRAESHARRGLATPTPAQLDAAVREESADGPLLREARAVLDAQTPDPAAARVPADRDVRARLDAHVRVQLGWGPPRPGTVTPGSSTATTERTAESRSGP